MLTEEQKNKGRGMNLIEDFSVWFYCLCLGLFGSEWGKAGAGERQHWSDCLPTYDSDKSRGRHCICGKNKGDTLQPLVKLSIKIVHKYLFCVI